jgi:hypothetical protein
MAIGMGRATVHIIGHIWQPGVGLCAQDQTMRGEEADRVKYPTWVDRDAVIEWAYIASGDFQEITDVALTFHDKTETPDLDWKDEASEDIYNECMAPKEDD